jgi:hypothetical protein
MAFMNLLYIHLNYIRTTTGKYTHDYDTNHKVFTRLEPLLLLPSPLSGPKINISEIKIKIKIKIHTSDSRRVASRAPAAAAAAITVSTR